MKKIAAIHDLSGYGRASLTVAIPILSYMGYQVCPLPTAILSAHSEYKDFRSFDLTDQMQGIIDHWKELDLHFDALYLRIGDIYKGELVMLNNLIFANGAGIFGDPSYTVANLRTPIEGYNNIIVGAEQGVNDAIDDECFNSGKAQYNNTVETLATYPLSNVALSTVLSTDNFVPYLALTAENSSAVNAGYATGEYVDLVPTTDIRGLAVVGTRDIGAYEYGATDPSAISSVAADESDFVIVANGDQISVMNTADRNFTLTVVDMLGRAVYAGNGAGMMTVNKQDIDAHCVIFVLTDGVSKKVQKMMLH